MEKYQIILTWSDDDNAFIAQVPELPGCMADGPTREAAIAAAHEVIGIWIETARELGREIPQPRKYGAGPVEKALVAANKR